MQQKDLDFELLRSICHRKVSFKFLRKAEGTYLERENCWKFVFDGCGGDTGDGFLEVEVNIPDED